MLERAQGYAFQDGSEAGTLPVNLYWNANPSHHLRGSQGDNVVSTVPPTQPGYAFVRAQGWIFNSTASAVRYLRKYVSVSVMSDEELADNATHLVKLWYSAAKLDHFTTASDADEAEATAGGYVYVATLGTILTPSAPLPPSQGPSCFSRSGNMDWYFFGHGMQYAQAVQDFVSIAGPVPIPRRHWLGMSWSRWGNEIVEEIMYEEVRNLTTAGYPLSTYILDMNWHLKPEWTGYTWDKAAYPNYTGMLAWMHAQGIATAVNLHDAEGVMPFEAAYPAMAAANGINSSASVTVPFDITNKTYADSLHALVLQPIADDGIDFWWTDWQQGLPGVSHVPGVTPIWVLNHYRFQNYSQAGSAVRGLTHSRFPGWGGHRYPSGFGGDVLQEWDSSSGPRR